MFEFIRDLSESKQFPHQRDVEKLKTKDIAEMIYLHLVALRILIAEEETKAWTKRYVKQTVDWSHFDNWRTNGTDLYVLLWALKQRGQKDDEHGSYPLNYSNLIYWLRDLAHDDLDDGRTNRLFNRLDFDLRNRHESQRSIRRLVMDWDAIDTYKKKLTTTRLLQFLRSRCARAEITTMLSKLSYSKDYELDNVCNMETGEGCDDEIKHKPSAFGFLRKK